MFALPPTVEELYLGLPWGEVLVVCRDSLAEGYRRDQSPSEPCDYMIPESFMTGARVTMAAATDKREAFASLVAAGVIQDRRGVHPRFYAAV